MKIRPLHDLVLVKALKNDTVTPGGLHIPEQAQGYGEKMLRAEVLAIGPGRYVGSGSDFRLHPCSVLPGQVVTLSAYGSTKIDTGEEGEFYMVHDNDLLGVLE